MSAYPKIKLRSLYSMHTKTKEEFFITVEFSRSKYTQISDLGDTKKDALKTAKKVALAILNFFEKEA